jgi:hypothetical protein
MIRASLFTLAMAAIVAASPAQAQRVDCEKIVDAHAYNRCIAAAGPASRAGSRAAPRSSGLSGAQAAPRRASRSRASPRGGVNVRRLPNGRVRMEIPAPRRR